MDFSSPIGLTAKDEGTGLDRYFQLKVDPRFIHIKSRGPLNALSDDDKRQLLANLTNVELWQKLLPAEQFEFQGFTVVHAIETTEQEVISSLKRDLIEKESIISDARFNFLQEKLRILLRKPNLILGLAALQGERVFPLNYGLKVKEACPGLDPANLRVSDYAGSIYARAVVQRRALVIDDLTTHPQRTLIEDTIIRFSGRSVLIAPLIYQDEVVGTFELASPIPGDLNALSAMQLHEVIPLFSMAIRRSLDDMNTQVQAVIKEKCTAIHSALEWRFRNAALSFLNKQKRENATEMEPIVFHNVYPLYGLSDIRGSSTLRNVATQTDLHKQLRLAREVIHAAQRARSLPFFDELVYRLSRHIEDIENGLRAGDEMNLLEFVRRDVESLFDHLRDYGAGVQEAIKAYQGMMDAELGILYSRRKDFEESVLRINDTIAAYLEAEEEKAQAMFPHYFEKHKTDGVDHCIYLGAALVEDGKFDPLYLKNMRLWQLAVVCGMAQRSEQLKPELTLPLETAHLILLHDAPLAVRFRMDEKHFDVDGAYNIRYEIIKKRIDKAMVKGRNERLTQPGKIAIVYSQSREATEYRQYIDYLQATGRLTGELEELELEDLQGVPGLRALRVTVDMPAADRNGGVELGEVDEVVRQLVTA